MKNSVEGSQRIVQRILFHAHSTSKAFMTVFLSLSAGILFEMDIKMWYPVELVTFTNFATHIHVALCDIPYLISRGIGNSPCSQYLQIKFSIGPLQSLKWCLKPCKLPIPPKRICIMSIQLVVTNQAFNSSYLTSITLINLFFDTWKGYSYLERVYLIIIISISPK